MSDDPRKNWTDTEAGVLRSLRDEPIPSSGVEDRIVDALKRRGQIRARGGPIVMIGKTAGLVAAAAAVFVGGFLAGNRSVEATNPADPAETVATPGVAGGDNEYMLLMFTRGEDETAEAPAPEAMDEAAYQAIIGEYRQWALDRAAEGRLVSAEKLASETCVMTQSAGNVAVTWSADDERVLGGYFLITSPSLDDAIELARTHPHLKYGGEVEVRPIETTRH